MRHFAPEAMRGPSGGVAKRLTRVSAASVSGDAPRPAPSLLSPAPLPYEYSSMTGADGRRDSGASSLCSSIRSSVGGRTSYSKAPAPSDSALYLRAVNSYLSSLSPPIFLKPPYPPARNIAEAFCRLLSRLDSGTAVNNISRDLPPLLAALPCPIKLSQSALKAPNTPHAWPSVIPVLYWLMQLAQVADHLLASPSLPEMPDIHRYLARSYCLFIDGEDSSVAELDAEYLDRVERHAALAIEYTESLEDEVAQLESKLKDIAAAPSRLEALRSEHAALLEDVKKFQNVVDKFSGMIEEKKEKLVERERELETRGAAKMRLDEENEALRQRIQAQALSSRDVERMTRELQAMEKDIFEWESTRNEMEENAWQLNSEVERMLREIETSTEQCNQEIRKLKIGNNFQHVLNPNASSAAEIIGVGYKTLLKPALVALSEEAKKWKVSKVEELISLQKQSHENKMMLDGKSAHCTTIQTKINEIEAQIDLFKKDTEDHALICSSQAEKWEEELAAKEQEVDILERKAKDFLMESEETLKRTTVECTEETRLCARELYALIDSVSKYREFRCSTIASIDDEIKEVGQRVKLAFATSIR